MFFSLLVSLSLLSLLCAHVAANVNYLDNDSSMFIVANLEEAIE